MTRTTNVKKIVSRKALPAISVAIAIASVVMTTTAWQIPQVIATSLEEIKVSREISAPVYQIWNIISDVCRQ
jgi:hypothetical protein